MAGQDGGDALAFLGQVDDESLLLDIPAGVEDALVTDELLLRDVDALLHGTVSTTADTSSSAPADMAITAITRATTKSKRSATATTKDASRRRQKDELAYLRAKVKQLEHELSELQRASPTVSTPTTDHESDNVLDQTVAPIWQRLARNQQAQKHKALMENAKLREMLEGQIRLAQALEKILRKRPTPEDVSVATSKMSRVEVADEKDIYAALVKALDTLPLQLAHAFEDAGIAHMATEMHDIRVKGTMASGVCMEMIECRLAPFPPHEIGAAAFHVLCRDRFDLPDGHMSCVDSSSDTVSCRGVIATKLRRTLVKLVVRVIFKRIVEADREVFVWRSLTSTEESSTAAFQGVTLHECAWATIEHVGPVSMIKSFIRLEPVLPAFTGSEQQSLQHVGLLSDLVLGSYNQNTGVVHQLIENAIMESLLERT